VASVLRHLNDRDRSTRRSSSNKIKAAKIAI
jgi:hypothetical protein